MSHVAHVNEAWHTYEWVMSHGVHHVCVRRDVFIHVRHGSFIYVTCLIHSCDVPHLHVCDVTHTLEHARRCTCTAHHFAHATCVILVTYSYMCDMTYIYMCDMTYSYMCDMTYSYMCDMTYSYMCDMTYSYVKRSTWTIPMCATWLIIFSRRVTALVLRRVPLMSHSYVWHDSFICVTWLIHMCDMTHSYVWHAPFVSATWLIYKYVTWLIILNRRVTALVSRRVPLTWHASFVCATWLIHTCATWLLDVCVMWLILLNRRVTALVLRCVLLVAHSCVWHALFVFWHDLFICVWRCSCLWTGASPHLYYVVFYSRDE